MKNSDRIPVIDFLRGLSCLGVLLYHVRVDLWVGWWRITSYPEEYSSFAKAMAWLSIPTPFMGYAVVLFFLISGFCIHYPNANGNVRPDWKTYLKRRFLRIYPTYLIAILFTSIISYYCHVRWDDNTWDLERILRVSTISQNYPPGSGQFLSNPSLWTIPLEIEFYVLYPIAFFFLLKFGFLKLFLLSFAISGIGLYLSEQGMQWISFTAAFLWPSWLLGSWVSYAHRKNILVQIKNILIYPIFILFLILALTSRLQNWESWIQYFCWTGFYCFLFMILLRSKRLFKIKDKLIFRSLAWLGRISFSLYLIHFPLFKLFGYFHCEFHGEKPANFLVTSLYIIPAIFVAWLFFKFIEHPIHKWSKNKEGAS